MAVTTSEQNRFRTQDFFRDTVLRELRDTFELHQETLLEISQIDAYRELILYLDQHEGEVLKRIEAGHLQLFETKQRLKNLTDKETKLKEACRVAEKNNNPEQLARWDAALKKLQSRKQRAFEAIERTFKDEINQLASGISSEYMPPNTSDWILLQTLAESAGHKHSRDGLTAQQMFEVLMPELRARNAKEETVRLLRDQLHAAEEQAQTVGQNRDELQNLLNERNSTIKAQSSTFREKEQEWQEELEKEKVLHKSVGDQLQELQEEREKDNADNETSLAEAAAQLEKVREASKEKLEAKDKELQDLKERNTKLKQDVDKEKNDAETSRKARNKEVEKLRKEALTKQKKELEHQYADDKSKLEDKFNKEKKELQSAIEKLQKQVDERDGRIEELDGAREYLENLENLSADQKNKLQQEKDKEIRNLKTSLRESKQRADDFEDAKERLEKEKIKFTTDKEKLEEILGNLQEEKNDWAEEKSELEGEVAFERGKKEEHAATITKLAEEKDELQKKFDDGVAKIAELNDSLEKAIEEKNAEVQKLQEDAVVEERKWDSENNRLKIALAAEEQGREAERKAKEQLEDRLKTSVQAEINRLEGEINALNQQKEKASEDFRRNLVEMMQLAVDETKAKTEWKMSALNVLKNEINFRTFEAKPVGSRLNDMGPSFPAMEITIPNETNMISLLLTCIDPTLDSGISPLQMLLWIHGSALQDLRSTGELPDTDYFKVLLSCVVNFVTYQLVQSRGKAAEMALCSCILAELSTCVFLPVNDIKHLAMNDVPDSSVLESAALMKLKMILRDDPNLQYDFEEDQVLEGVSARDYYAYVSDDRFKDDIVEHTHLALLPLVDFLKHIRQKALLGPKKHHEWYVYDDDYVMLAHGGEAHCFVLRPQGWFYYPGQPILQTSRGGAMTFVIEGTNLVESGPTDGHVWDFVAAFNVKKAGELWDAEHSESLLRQMRLVASL